MNEIGWLNAEKSRKNTMLSILQQFVHQFVVGFFEIYKQQNRYHLPKELSLMIYGYIESQEIIYQLAVDLSLQSEHSKDIMNEIWRSTKISNWSGDMEQFIEIFEKRNDNEIAVTHVDEDTFKSKLFEEKVLCLGMLNMIETKEIYAVGILTTHNIYLTYNIRNYPIWNRFKTISKIDELILDYNTKIDQETAIQITRNLHIAPEILDMNGVKITENIIGMTKISILINLLFYQTLIKTLSESFGLLNISGNPDELIWKLYGSKNKISYEEENEYIFTKYARHDNLCKIVDLSKFDEIEKFDSNKYYLALSNSVRMRLNSKHEYAQWIGHINALLNGSVILIQGLLQKQSKILKVWKVRWFRLYSNGFVNYYNTKCDVKPIGSIDCSKFNKIEQKSFDASNNKKYGMQLFISNKIIFKVLCKNNKQRQEWMKAFKYIKQKYQY